MTPTDTMDWLFAETAARKAAERVTPTVGELLSDLHDIAEAVPPLEDTGDVIRSRKLTAPTWNALIAKLKDFGLSDKELRQPNA